MSRYVELETVVRTRAELLDLLAHLGLAPDVGCASRPVMLAPTLECAGEPVEIRVAADALGTTQDFGFRESPTGLVLVCGDLDRDRVESAVMAPMNARVLEQRMRADEHARATTGRETDATTRILVDDDSGENEP